MALSERSVWTGLVPPFLKNVLWTCEESEGEVLGTCEESEGEEKEVQLGNEEQLHYLLKQWAV